MILAKICMKIAVHHKAHPIARLSTKVQRMIEKKTAHSDIVNFEILGCWTPSTERVRST